MGRLGFGGRMLDLESLKTQVDLLSICEQQTHLKKVAATHGGEWAGPCPFCPEGGVDRFHVQPFARPFPRWMCRHCTSGKWDSVIGFIARRDGLDPKKKSDLLEICNRAGVSPQLLVDLHRPQPRPPAPAYAPPDEAWQAAARDAIAVCETALWQPEGALVREYLAQRGLSGETIRHFHLGYCHTSRVDQYGREMDGLYVPRGLVIPCNTANQVWYLKIRLVPGIPCRCQHCRASLPGPGKCPHCGKDSRYLAVRGSKPAALFNGDALTSGQNMALFCEGEIDCMTAWQEFGDIMPTATIGGSASNHLDLAIWGYYLRSFRSILVTYDADSAGENGAHGLMDISDRVRLAPLPEGYKDINEFHQKGGDLLSWIVDLQRFYLDPAFK